MRILFPAPLQAGSRIAVTAPSSGVEPPLHPRLDLCLAHLRAQDFVVEEGQCLRNEARSASAPAEARAAELMHFLLRDDIAAVIPPWGGELACEILDRLDWPALAAAKPKWVLGYSDTSTWMLPLTLRLGWATAHGPCLMDLVAGQRDALSAGVMPALATATGGGFTQRQGSHWQKQWTDFAAVPGCTYALTEPTHWRTLRGEAEVSCSGRLVGGCIDTLMHTAATPFGDVAAFIQRHRADGVLLYLENSGLSPTDWVRALHRLRWAEALASTLAALPCPVLMDMDIGHVPPQLLLVNGALARVHWSASGGGTITQTLA